MSARRRTSSTRNGRRGATHFGGTRRGGFTLIEAAFATMIVGVGFVAVLQLVAAGTAANADAVQSTTAVNLAKNVNEMLLQQKYKDLLSFNGKTYSPPRDSRGTAVSGFDTWEQALTVKAVNPDRLTQDVVDSSPDGVRVTVTMNHNGQKVCDVSWYVFDGTP